VRERIAGAVKAGLRRSGYYTRALADRRFPGVAVLTYHGIREDERPNQPMPFANLHVFASTFAEHCAVIRETCDPIGLDDWRAAIAGRAPLPPRPVLITFDDGYRSVLTHAAPVLAEYDLPAVVFACSGPMEARTMLWFDALAERDGEAAVEGWKSRAYNEWSDRCPTRLPVKADDPRALLTVAELQTLSRQRRIEIGAHTETHPILARGSAEQQRGEIERNRRSLEAWTGRPVRAFAYPNGRPGLDYDAETIRIVRDCGFDVAFTTRPTFAVPSEPDFERSRFTMLNEITATELVHRLAHSWHN
jgi:peptidoglycan/xylan/chitin deacetylase (PgdA/CDA1 family)